MIGFQTIEQAVGEWVRPEKPDTHKIEAANNLVKHSRSEIFFFGRVQMVKHDPVLIT